MRLFRFRYRPGENRVIFWAVFCFVLLTAQAAVCATETPQKAFLSATIEKSSAAVGELLWLTLNYSLPRGARLTDPLSVDGLESLSIVEQVTGAEQLRFRIVVDRLAQLETGTIRLAFLDKDGSQQRIETGPVAVTVLSNLGEKPEEAALRPIQDILPTGSRWLPFLPWLAAAVLLLGIIAGWWFWKKRNQRMEGAVSEPAHVRAEKEIDCLVNSGLFERGEMKVFYFQFSEILRRYMGAIRDFSAMEMTTEEIARHIGNHSRDQVMMPLLRQADMVKFADAVPTRHGNEQDVRKARAYIRATRPVTAEGESQEKNA